MQWKKMDMKEDWKENAKISVSMTLLYNTLLMRKLIKSLGEQIKLLLWSYKNIEKLLDKTVQMKISFKGLE